MLKHHSALCLVLAGAVGVPAIAFQDRLTAADLGRMVNQTVDRMERLTGVRERIVAHDETAIEELRELTEAPIPASRERDEQYAGPLLSTPPTNTWLVVLITRFHNSLLPLATTKSK